MHAGRGTVTWKVEWLGPLRTSLAREGRGTASIPPSTLLSDSGQRGEGGVGTAPHHLSPLIPTIGENSPEGGIDGPPLP